MFQEAFLESSLYLHLYKKYSKGRNTKLPLYYCEYKLAFMFLWAVCLYAFTNIKITNCTHWAFEASHRKAQLSFHG